MVTVALLVMSKTRLALLPLTVRFTAPGPSMSRLLLMTSWPPRQGDRVDGFGEEDFRAGAGSGDHGSQRAARTIVERARDRQRAGQPAIFEHFEPQTGHGPFARHFGRVTAHTRTGAFLVPQPGREPHGASPFRSWSAIELKGQ